MVCGFVVNVMFIVGVWVYFFVGMVYVIFKVVLVLLMWEMVVDFGFYGVWVNVIVLGEIEILILLFGIEKLIDDILFNWFG